ncbi:hypothetical protein CIL06_22980 [Pantoea vagans]|nr:hypothetical protein CIL06_22980 [Pantoea vagans]
MPVPPHRCIRLASKSTTAVAAGSSSASRPVQRAKVTSAAAAAPARPALSASDGIPSAFWCARQARSANVIVSSAIREVVVFCIMYSSQSG